MYLDIGKEKLGTEYMRKACGMSHEAGCYVAAECERYFAEVAARDARIAAQTREKYRYAHCTMAGSNQSAAVCR